jgi:hypothetical protein
MSTSGKKDKDGSSEGPQQKADPEAERFVNDLLVREEAAKPASSGKLPLDATHAITKQTPDGTVTEVKRARFKLF